MIDDMELSFETKSFYTDSNNIERVVEAAGFSVSPIWEAMSTTALVNAVINGLGIAVLPHRMVIGPIERGLVVAVRVKGLSFKRKFHIVYLPAILTKAAFRLISSDCFSFARNEAADRTWILF